jgi:hypothetical protein
VAVVIASIVLVGAVVAALAMVFPSIAGEYGENDGSSAATSEGSADPPGARYDLAAPADPSTIAVGAANWSSWALLDRRTGAIAGPADAGDEANTTESMVKPWIVADYLRQLTAAGEQPDQETLDELTLVIVDSNDPLAEKYYQLGGGDELIQRLAATCGLTDLGIESTLWGMTWMTPQDAVRYGLCIADGRAAGPNWTPWLLSTMKEVRGGVEDQDSGEVQGGRWGIIEGLPAELARDLSFKNGWTLYEDGWHVNCLAIHPEFVFAVMMRMPATLPEAAQGCADVAAALVVERHS